MVRWFWVLLPVMAVMAPTVVATDAPATGLSVHAIPSSDGQEAWVWAKVAEGLGTSISGLLCDSVSGSCQTMTCAALSCGGTLTGLPAQRTVEGQLTVTITLTPTQSLESGPLSFTRAFMLASELSQAASPDNMLELMLLPDSLPADTYVLILAASALPGPPPPLHRPVGRPYGIRASGALVLSDEPMALRLAYDTLWLGNATPHNLSIFAWDPFTQTWRESGGTLFTEHNHLSVPVQRFTTYALMEVPAWRDTFADASGLSRIEGTSPTPEGALILSADALTGTAVSIPITPTVANASWGRVVFTHTTSPTTNLTMDILSLDDSELLTDVASGVSLTSLDPAQYPALKLRANLSSTVAGKTPVLDAWRLEWEMEEHKVYLPVVVR